MPGFGSVTSEEQGLLAELVALAPTNLEDPAHGRWEKPNYSATAERIAEVARAWGLSARIVDARELGVDPKELHGGARPNVVVDLIAGARSRVTILAHYDVVPVPDEQRARWQSEPHRLTPRPDGRWYGRGTNDDLGSGVVAALSAMRRLRTAGNLRHNVRLLACCDEETGGEGGVEAFKAADANRAPSDPDRYLAADVVLIPDGSPHATAASSGVVFLDAYLDRGSLPEAIEFGEYLVTLDSLAKRWVSRYPSEDWPDHGAPFPTVTGRANVTKLDLEFPVDGSPGHVALLQVHAETEASNQVAEAVTLVFGGEADSLRGLPARLASALTPPFRLSTEFLTSLPRTSGTVALQVVGKSTHGGYPHRGHNPVPRTLELLKEALERSWIAPGAAGAGTFGIDLRLTPEMSVEEGRDPALALVHAWIGERGLSARVDAPPARSRGGYALPLGDPSLDRMQRILHETVGSPGVYGEYGGTDASSLVGLLTPSGAPLPAIVFGSMDRSANIHEAEESVDPHLLGGIIESIVRFVRDA